MLHVLLIRSFMRCQLEGGVGLGVRFDYTQTLHEGNIGTVNDNSDL